MRLHAQNLPMVGLRAHLLGRIAFPEASLGCGESTAERLAAEPGDAQRHVRDFDEEHYVDDRGPLMLAGVHSLPPDMIPRASEIQLRMSVIFALVGIAAFVTIVSSLAPGIVAMNSDPHAP